MNYPFKRSNTKEVFDASVRQIYVSVAQIICNQPSNWHLLIGQKATIRFLKRYMDWRDIWRLIICTISCKYPEIPENILPLLSGYEQTNRTKWLFLVGQYSLGIVNLMMTLTSLLWSAGLQLKLCHKDTSVSYYSAQQQPAARRYCLWLNWTVFSRVS